VGWEAAVQASDFSVILKVAPNYAFHVST